MTASSNCPTTRRSAQSFVEYRGLGDPVIEIKITPDRADCLGVFGVARDLASAGLGKLKPIAEKQIKGTFQEPDPVEDR